MAFFGGGVSVDLASPPAIGNTTPNTGAFTTLSFAPANNTTGFSNTSNSLTGSNAQSLINLAQTWNTTGTPTGLKFNITDTASNSASLIFDFQIGGTSRLSLRKDGRLNGAGAFSVLRSSGFEAHDGATIYYFVNPYTGNVGIYTSASIQWGSGAAPNNNQGDIKIIRDTTGVLALQNGLNSQSLRLYNTFTDASNYERGFMRWNANAFEIGTEKAGTGSARFLHLVVNGSLRFTIDPDASIIRNNSGDSTFRTGGSGSSIIQAGSNTLAVGSDSGNNDLRTSCAIFKIGGTTSSFPALKRSSAILQVRLADDSGYTVLDAQLRAQGTAPATAGGTGTAGDIRYDADYIYICTAANTWKRVAIATW